MNTSIMLGEDSNTPIQNNNVAQDLFNDNITTNSRELFWDDVIERTTNLPGVLDEDDIDSISPSVASLPGYDNFNGRAYGLFSSEAVDGLKGSSSTPVEHTDNFFDKIFENLEEHDHSTEAEPCKAVATKLYPHQKQALNWMMGKENENTLPPFWEQRGENYVNTITYETRKTVNSVRGGILADDMGLGKTLEMIALILTNFVDGKPLARPISRKENTPVKSVDVKKNKPIVKSENKVTILSYFSPLPSTTAADSVLETCTTSKTLPFRKTSSSQLFGKPGSSDLKSSQRSEKRMNTNEDINMEADHSSSKYGRWEVTEEGKDDIQLLDPLPEPQNLLSNFVETDYDSKDTSNSASVVDVSDSESVIVISDSDTDEELDRTPKPTLHIKTTDDNSLLETILPPWQSHTIDEEVDTTPKLPVIKKITGEKFLGFKRKHLQEKLKPLQPQESECTESQQDCCDDYDPLTGRCQTTGPRGTLIVCPTSVLYTWEDQFSQHVDKTVRLNLYIHYGTSRTTNMEFIKEQDVVITTYHTVIADYKKADKGPIYNTEWLRIVLDEGHHIRNSKTSTAKIIFELKAQRRWVLSGTPIQNTLEDLWSIVNFLKVEPLTDKRCWNRTIAVPVASDNDSAMQRVFHLMRNLSLRRTKTQQVNGKPILELPARNVVLRKLTLNKEQREAYDRMENEGKILIRQYIEDNTVPAHLFEIYVAQLRLRQFCCHPKLVYKAVVSNPVHVSDVDNQRYHEINHNDHTLTCSACSTPPKNVVITSNGGIYCWTCIQRNTGRHQANMVAPGQEVSILEIQNLREQLNSANKSEEDCIVCTNTLQAGVITPKGHMYCRTCFEENPDITQAYESISEAKRKQLLGKLLMWLYEEEEYSECPICYTKSMEIGYQNAVITFCGHQFCSTCIEKLCQKEAHPLCPICRNELDSNRLITIPRKLTEGMNLDEWSSSAKIDALMTALTDLREGDPSIKSIVISQFTSFLDLIEKALSEKNLLFTRLDGKMSQRKRLDAMKRFSEDNPESPMVFLLSLKAGGVGINLTAASRVFLMEPYWNPAAEEQCFDRCHRLGQTRDVEITKFVIENSVEENMLKLQERKRQLMNAAFLRKLTKEQRRTNYVNDLIQFFQID